MKEEKELKITITEHAYERAKERLSLNKKSLDRMAIKAFKYGIEKEETKGKLRMYLEHLHLSEKKANNIRLHGENVFLFCGKNLVTVYQVTNNIKKYLKKERERIF